ncbi:hypothetical protein ACJ72_07729, partial [Emergomyces africanus]
WFTTLRAHLAGAAIDDKKWKHTSDNLFSRIVTLKTGEALVFCPSAIFDLISDDDTLDESNSSQGEDKPHEESALKSLKIKELGPRYARVRMRKRITTDGGRSILAET